MTLSTENRLLELVGTRFMESGHPEALVYMPQSCATLGVNRAHTEAFNNTKADLLNEVEAFGAAVRKSNSLRPDPICHCEKIRAMEILNPRHCLLERLYESSRSTGVAQKGINFLLNGSDQTGSGSRFYDVYVVEGDTLSEQYPRAFAIKLEKMARYQVVVSTTRSTDAQIELNVTIIVDGQEQKPKSHKNDAKRDDPTMAEYWRVYGQLAALLGHSDDILSAEVRKVQEHYQRSNKSSEYPHRSLFNQIDAGAADIRTELLTIKARLFDGPTLIETVQSELERTLLPGGETYPYRTLVTGDGIERTRRAALLTIAFLNDEDLTACRNKFEPADSDPKPDLREWFRAAVKTSDERDLLRLDRTLESIEARASRQHN